MSRFSVGERVQVVRSSSDDCEIQGAVAVITNLIPKGRFTKCDEYEVHIAGIGYRVFWEFEIESVDPGDQSVRQAA